MSGGISVDWTLNLTTMVSIVIISSGVIAAFVSIKNKVDSLAEDMNDFKMGLREFQTDFKLMGGQVVTALISIARLEGKTSKNGIEEQTSSTLLDRLRRDR